MSILSSTNKFYSRGSPTAEIPDNQLCTVYQCNHVIDVISIQKRSSSISDYRKVSKSLYCDTKSGEVFEYKKHEKRYHSLKDTFTNLRRLINNNFTGRHSELMLVLTYSTYMDNPEQLYQDFRKFWLRFKYHFPPSEYIVIIDRILRVLITSRIQTFRKSIRLQRCWLKMLDCATIPQILKFIGVLRESSTQSRLHFHIVKLKR